MDEIRRIKEALNAIDDPRTLLEQLFACSPLALQILRADGTCVVGNKAFRGMFGSEPPSGFNQRDEIADAVRRALAGETVYVPTFCYDARAGANHAEPRRVTVSSWFFPLRNSRGEIDHVVFVAHNDSEEVAASDALEHERDRLRQIETHLKAAQRITHCGSWELDVSDVANIKPIYWSEETFRVFGYDSDATAVTAENFFRLVPPEDAALIQSQVVSAIEHHGPFELDHRIVRPDGVVRIVHLRSEIQYRDGKPVLLIGTSHDVTEQRHDHAALLRSEERLRSALHAGKMIAWDLEFETGSLSVSENAAEVLGLRREQSLDRLAQGLDLVHPDDRNRVTDALADAQTHGREPELQFRIVRPDDNSVVWLEMRASVVRDVEGLITGVRGLSTDITRRHQAEEELRSSEARYRTHFEHAPEAISIFDVDTGCMIDVNGPAEKLFGVTRAELLTRNPVTDFSPPTQPDGEPSLEAATVHMNRALAGDTPVFEWMHCNSTGEERPCEVRLVRVPEAGRNILRATLIDIRERKRHEELRARSAELELLNHRIQEASRLKSEFLANMSHELRTPLNAIIGFAELLHSGHVESTSPQHKEFLGDILSSGRHLLQLINDILDLSKIEAGKLEFHPTRASVLSLVTEVCAVLRTTMTTKHINLETDVDPSIDEVWLDPSRFKQVLYNYLSNALKFTQDGGRVSVRAHAAGTERLRIEVEDTGIGIAPRDVVRLFQDFQQLETGASKRHSGTGLGLALTKRLVEAQGGTVGVQSRLGAGSTFHAVLPCRGQVLLFPHSTVDTPPSDGPNVLVVEDNPGDRSLITETLRSAGFVVTAVETGIDALTLCQERRFDAITLALLLPDMSGLEVLAGLRASRNSAVPVVVITVVSDRNAVAGFTVHDVLHKPLQVPALLAALQRTGLRPEVTGSILVVDDDARSLKLMEAALADLGRRAVCRRTGASGLDAVQTLRPAGIILDLLMPGMDGFEFLVKLREMPDHQLTPVIVWTGKDLAAAEMEFLRATAQAVFAKGHDRIASLGDVLHSVLGHPTPAGETKV